MKENRNECRLSSKPLPRGTRRGIWATRVGLPLAGLALVAFALAAGLRCTSGGSAGTGKFDAFASAYRITNRNQLIGGRQAIAAEGDLILENDQIRLAILGAWDSFGPGLFGGSLADADLQRANGTSTGNRGNDQLAEIFPTIDIQVQKPAGPDTMQQSIQPLATSIEVLEAGGKGKGAKASVRVEASLTPLISVIGLIPVSLATSNIRLVQDYTLEAGNRYATIETEVRFLDPGATDFQARRTFEVRTLDKPIKALFPILLGQVYGDIAIFGASTTLFAPSFGFDGYSALLQPNANPTPDQPWNEKRPFRNTFEEPLQGPFIVGRGKGVSYGLALENGQFSIPLMAGAISPELYGSSFDIVDPKTGRAPSPAPGDPGDAIRYHRYFIVGDGDVASILDWVNVVRKQETGRIVGNVREQSTGHAMTGAHVLLFQHPRDAQGNLRDVATLSPKDLGSPVSEFTTDIRIDDTEKDGSFTGTTAPGSYILMGITTGHGRSPLYPVEVTAGKEARQTVVIPRDGEIRVRVVDPNTGRESLPCKLTVVELDGHGVPWPRYGEGSLPIANIPRKGAIYEPQSVDAAREDLEFIAAFHYTPNGEWNFTLEPGRYRVYASRGYEYSLDRKDVTIEPGLSQDVSLAITRVVDSTGWLSGDFHVHSFYSQDGSRTPEDTVIGYAAEDVEILNSTDHDYLSDYEPVLQSLGLRKWLKTLIGNELTTFETGHYNGMPLKIDRGQPANGAIPWTNLSPPQIFDALRAKGSLGPDQTITINNHPRDSIFGYYGQFGFDQGTGVLCASNFITYGNPIIRRTFFGPIKSENFCLDCFTAMEVLNAKRLEMIRTPTTEEIPPAADDQKEPLDPPSTYEVLSRTMDEQKRILDNSTPLALIDQGRYQGGVDDFFTTLNLGHRVTGLGDSDSHHYVDTAMTRSWIQMGTDSPDAVDDLDVVERVRAGRVVMGYGPFITFRIAGAEIGDTVTVRGGTVDLDIRVQGPEWFEVSRVEVYGNGELAAEQEVSLPNRSTEKFRGRITVDVRDLAVNDHKPRDTYFVVVALGPGNMFPVDFPVNLPVINTSDVVVGSLTNLIPGLANVDNISQLTFNVLPYGLTNPVFVDVDGDGKYTAPGKPPVNGRFKLPQCAGAATPEDCACKSIELPEEKLWEIANARRQAFKIYSEFQAHKVLRGIGP